jgi:hypothetical protein
MFTPTAPRRPFATLGSLVLIVVLAVLCAPSPAAAQSAASVTYQGVLTENDLPVTGIYDIRFELYDARQGGQKISPTLCVNDVKVTSGLFTVIIPLPALTSGTPVFLEVSTRLDNGEDCSGSEGYIALARRQAVTPAPIAVAASVITQRSPSVPGALRYNPTDKRFEGFTGIFWVPLTQGPELAPANVQYFNPGTTTNFVVPPGVTRIGVNLSGAGGGGGARTAGNLTDGCVTPGSTAGYGGGSGAALRAFVDVTPGETLTIIVGQGGAGASTPGTQGAPGGDTILRRDTVNLLIAGGGKGGGPGTLALSVQGGANACRTFAQSQFLTGQPGLASAPGTGVTPIALLNGNGGGSPALGICNGGGQNYLGCGGSGGEPRTISGPLAVSSGGNGNGAPFAQTGSGFTGGPGSADIWWD